MKEWIHLEPVGNRWSNPFDKRNQEILRLKKCKHCGGRGLLVERNGGWDVTCENTQLIGRLDFNVFCHERDDDCPDLCNSPNEAIENWNDDN